MMKTMKNNENMERGGEESKEGKGSDSFKSWINCSGGNGDSKR